MTIQVLPVDGNATEVSCDALVVGAFADGEGFTLGDTASAIDQQLDGYLSEYLQEANFKAKPGQVAILPTMKKTTAKAIAVVGVGSHDDLDDRAIRRAGGAAARRLSERTEIASALHELSDHAAAPAAEGFILGSYRYWELKSDPAPSKLERVLMPGAPASDVERGVAFGEAISFARDLVNEPASTLTPDVLANKAREAANANGFECEVLDETELAAQNFGGVIGVAKGSDIPPRFIKLRYGPSGAKGKVALVGKGVTFDSGGLSLKDAKSMETMKTDMAGAAAVIATVIVAARLKLAIEILAFVPAVENLPSGKSIKPGDVIHHYNKKTVEVLNTDAEGRLILADGLAFASEAKPDAIIDAATLTGSIMVALGRDISGLFVNDDTLAEELENAAKAAGEDVWRMPLYDDYKNELESEVADLKNVGSRWGGAIIAALFLQNFVAKGIPWAHFDIAGAARAEGDTDAGPKGGTGIVTRTLVNWLEGRAR
ncbi:MAG: leucyl aminopeptidase [Actinomycetota bacterium]|jgi:leucyl aminopeptidase|nr:leucyl aminopeptidase [Actinomycetota bacterium]